MLTSRSTIVSLYAQDHILLEVMNTVDEDVRTSKLLVGWLSGAFWRRAVQQRVFTYRHQSPATDVSQRWRVRDEASNADKQDEAVTAYSTALPHNPSSPTVY